MLRFVLIAILIFISLTPLLIYFLILPRLKRQWNSRLRRARNLAAQRRLTEIHRQRQEYELETYNFCIGDSSCRFNAHSPYLRCAVNPCGPCENCRYYEPED